MLALGKEHNITICTSMDPQIKCSEVCASTDVEKVTPQVMFDMTHLLAQTMPMFGFHCVANIVDAAGPNWKALLADSTLAAKDFLPQELMDQFEVIDFEIVHITKDIVTGEPIINAPDLLHLSKNVVTAMEMSWKKDHKRFIMYKKCPFHLGLVKDAFVATGGGSNQLQPTRLSSRHFNRDANSRMDCNAALNILSGSTANMIEAAINDDAIETIGSIRLKKILLPLMHFIRRWNFMVDIMLGKSKYGNYTPSNGRLIQVELLKIMKRLSEWQKDHAARVAEGTRTKWNFFADETWNCIKMLISSHLVLIEVYCIGKGMEVDPHRFTTDPCEHHFGNARQCVGGSTHALTASAHQQSDNKASLAEEANYAAVGNNRNAKPTHDSTQMKVCRPQKKFG